MAWAAEDLVERLGLLPHPEGGWYRETYRAADTLQIAGLPPRFPGPRACSTAIYYLLAAGHWSAFHRIRSDEVWHLYAGGPLLVHVLGADGALATHRLGMDLAGGETPQAVVPAGAWFASEPAPGAAYALAGCTVAPGFDFADFELAVRAELARAYPAHAALITRLTRS